MDGVVLNIRNVVDSMGTENVPILRIIAIHPINMEQLYEGTKDAQDLSLSAMRSYYTIMDLKDEERFSILLIQDILKKDINHPTNASYYIELKRRYQTIEKFSPRTVKTFFYSDEEIPELEAKIKRGIQFAFDEFKKKFDVDQMAIEYQYITQQKAVNQSWNKSWNTHMQELINKVIYDNFCVINETSNNDFNNKFVIIKEKENENNGNNAG